MKILFPIGIFYPSQIGGPANAIAWMVKALHNKGIETTVIATMFGISSGIEPNKWANNQFGKIIYTNIKNFHLCFPLFYNSFLKLPQKDIVHLTSIFHFPNLFIYIYAAFLGKGVVWSPGGEFAKSALNFKATKKMVYLWFLKLICSKKIVYHSSSPQETKDIQRVFGAKAKIFQIPNLIEAPEHLGLVKKKQLLFVGRIHPIKAIENLIEACNKSENFKQSEYKLVIAGDFKNRYGFDLISMVENFGLKNKIEFIGHIEGNEKIKLYAESYFLFLPSHSENFANVVTESLSQGTPVVASTGTPWSVLNTEKSGFWISNSPNSFSEVIDKVINLDLNSYDEYSKNAYKLLHERYEINSSIHKWISFYENLLIDKYNENVYYDM